MVKQFVENSYVKLTTVAAILTVLLGTAWKLSTSLWTITAAITDQKEAISDLATEVREDRWARTSMALWVRNFQIEHDAWVRETFPELRGKSGFVPPDPFSSEYKKQ